MAAIDPPAPMTNEQKELVAAEDEARHLFADQPDAPMLQDPHLLLHDVYAAQQAGKYAYCPETPEEAKVPKILTQHRRLDLTGSAIVPQEQFRANWAEFTQGCLEGLDWTNIFAAGGAVLGCLASETGGYKSSDIDLFIYGIRDEQQANTKLRQVYDVVLRNTRGKGDVIRTHRAITILCSYPYRHIQLILRLYKSPAEVLLGFDIDSCCVGYDGRGLWAMERFRRALTKRYNLVNISRRSLTYERRLFKYSKRGFAVAVPNLDKARVDPSLFGRNPKELQGLAKLLLFDYASNNKGQGFRMQKRLAALEEEGSDYNADLPIPWGPDWQNEAIINMLESKNKAKFFASFKKPGAPKGAESKAKSEFDHMLTSDAARLQASGFASWQRALDKQPVTQPLSWIKDNPAYQDFDNGFRRLMTGSFEPVVDGNWEKGAYSDGQKGQAATFLSTNASAAREPAPLPFAFGKPAPAVKKQAAPFASKLKAIKEKKAAVKRKRDDSEGEGEGSDLSGSEEESEEDRPKKSSAKVSVKKAVKKATPKKAPMKTHPVSPPKNTGVFAPATPTKTVSFGQPPAPYTPSPTSGGIIFGASPSIAAFGGGTGPAVTPSRGLSAFGPQPGMAPASNPYASPAPNPYPSPAPAPAPALFQGPPSAYQPGPAPASYPLAVTPAPATPQLLPPASAAAPPATFATPYAKILLLLALFAKQNKITSDEKSKLKDLLLRKDEVLLAALEVFEVDQDLDELADTFRRLASFRPAH